MGIKEIGGGGGGGGGGGIHTTMIFITVVLTVGDSITLKEGRDTEAIVTGEVVKIYNAFCRGEVYVTNS